MWWKFSLLALVSAGLIFCVIPIRTHAVQFDPSNPPPKWTILSAVSNMYLTPGAIASIAVIIAIAAIVGFWISRS